jgi:hypothetical protein
MQEQMEQLNEWEYLVKWKNTFAPEEWLPVKNFHDLQPIREFLEEQRSKRPRRE